MPGEIRRGGSEIPRIHRGRIPRAEVAEEYAPEAFAPERSEIAYEYAPEGYAPEPKRKGRTGDDAFQALMAILGVLGGPRGD